MKIVVVMLLVASLMFSGCASPPEEIEAAYVSPLEYQSYSCSQLTEEMRRIGRRVREVAGDQAETASDDSVAMGIGLVLFWPALFFISGDDRAEELARLKGEAEASEQAAIQKNCHELLEQLQQEREQLEQERKAIEEKKADSS